MSILDASIGSKEGLIASRASCCFLPTNSSVEQVVWPYSQCPQSINSPHMLLTKTLCWLIVIALLKRKSWGRHLLEIINVLKFLTFQTKCPTLLMSEAKKHEYCWQSHCPCLLLGTRSQQTPSHRHHPAPTAIKTQPLSNCCPTVWYVLVLTKAQGKGTWALLAKAFDNYLAKEDCLEDPFKTNPQELSTLCIYPENSWTTQRMCQSKKYCLSQLLPKTFILHLRRNIPWTAMTLIVFCFGNHAMERNASTFIY